MRIRTIKPEFWTHRKTGRLSLGAKCLAIGLLNLADDEGYFEADPVLIRSALFPFTESSVRIHGVLTELSAINYIEIRQNDEHGILVGCVCNFLEHQRISHPTASKLKAYHDSGSPHGGFTEDSAPEGKGKERNKERKRNRETTPIVPNGDFDIFWDAYPRHDDMKSAMLTWNRLNPPLQVVLDGIRKYKKSGRWNDRKFIPLPATFLNKERYDDEL